jgi:acyl-CoA synthetase (AMP-forming)/AMP-acid ligase II
MVQLRPGTQAPPESLLEECSKHIARYKLPRVLLLRDAIVRSPSGRADYRWAKSEVERG